MFTERPPGVRWEKKERNLNRRNRLLNTHLHMSIIFLTWCQVGSVVMFWSFIYVVFSCIRRLPFLPCDSLLEVKENQINRTVTLNEIWIPLGLSIVRNILGSYKWTTQQNMWQIFVFRHIYAEMLHIIFEFIWWTCQQTIAYFNAR